jgi:uncharacterized membrane protein YraQ (UPF0718 family)
MLHDAFLFLAAGIACAVFGLIYEIFSHEVYSFYMIYAFLILLVPGTLLNLVIVWRAVRKERYLRIKEAAARESAELHYAISNGTETQVSTGVFFPGRFTRHAWNSGLAALTVGSIFKGVLDIYGTTNKLIAVYPAAAAVLISAAVISFSMSYAAIRKMRRETETSSI